MSLFSSPKCRGQGRSPAGRSSSPTGSIAAYAQARAYHGLLNTMSRIYFFFFFFVFSRFALPVRPVPVQLREQPWTREDCTETKVS